MRTEKLAYRDGSVALEAHMAFDSSSTMRRPLVLVAHAWMGQDDFARTKAEQLAGLGYVGCALDMYGKSVLARDNKEAERLMSAVAADRNALRRRINQGLEAARAHAQVDQGRVAAIGFCFGGLCVLDLARSGASLLGVVSFHGILATPDPESARNIRCKVLALHGNDDPFVPPAQVTAFRKEMNDAGVDWQMHTYGKTVHAFTVEDANDLKLGCVYSRSAARRAWQAMTSFFAELFGS